MGHRYDTASFLARKGDLSGSETGVSGVLGCQMVGCGGEWWRLGDDFKRHATKQGCCRADGRLVPPIVLWAA